MPRAGHVEGNDALRAGFSPIWEAADELVLAFTENEVRYAGHTVLEESTKSSDSLPWIFYKDGVRELRFLRGFDNDELTRLLDILQRVRKASPDEDDLLTMLWHVDFAFLRYRYVDMNVEPTVPLTAGAEFTGATSAPHARMRSTASSRFASASTRDNSASSASSLALRAGASAKRLSSTR